VRDGTAVAAVSFDPTTPHPSIPPVEVDPPRPVDLLWMARALEQARRAGVRGEVPVGAVVVRDGRLLAEGHNLTVTRSDPTAHAEVVALRRAARRQGDWRLVGATLYATLEPCTLCCGASVLARVERVVYGASDPKAGMAGSLGNLLQRPDLNHRARITPGVLAEVGGDLLRAFFRARRG
jgi:tRNA(adenine34) deaminase